MNTATMEPEAPAYAEAVIISGPRKGEFITLPNDERYFLPEQERLLSKMVDEMMAVAERMAQSARAARLEAEEMLEILRA